jgi:hypothetical protein
MASCLPLEKIPDPITAESIKLNGISMHLLFLAIVGTMVYSLGWKITLVLILFSYLLALLVRKRALRQNFKKTTIENIREGDVIIVCRGGVGGESADWVELFVYHISSLLYTGSIYGHVGQVFRDYDGELKVADVRYNKKHKNNTQHYIDSIEDFIKNYEGIHYVVHRNLTEDQSRNLTDAVHLVAENTGHCTDCFNPFRLLETPSHKATPEFGKKHGLGCAENVTMIQRIAGISEIHDRFVTPVHFTKNHTLYRL